MAYHASQMPAGGDTTFYDVGRLISLWVSAFEILVHPGDDGYANRNAVFGLLERVIWARPGCAALAHDTGGRQKVKRTLASWLYQSLYDRRNDFLHGNPVSRDTLFLPASGRNLFLYAAPLYRLALTAYLDLRPASPLPDPSDAASTGAAVTARMKFLEPQRTIEEATETALRPVDDPATAGRRTRVLRSSRSREPRLT
jgi:hypothetical protein